MNETAAAKYTALCTPYAWLFRFFWGLIGSSIIILSVLAVEFGDVFFKAIIEDNGTYAGWIEDIKVSNEKNLTELTFP